MQKFTKSMGSFGWAMSLFGIQQTLNLFKPVCRDSGMHPTTSAFQALTSATVNQLGATTQRTFQAVDGIQRQMLDLGFSLVWPVRNGTTSSWSDVAQQTASRAQSWAGAGPSSRSDEPTGWGPVPPGN
jgi:hypothetical protein